MMSERELLTNMGSNSDREVLDDVTEFFHRLGYVDVARQLEQVQDANAERSSGGYW